MSQLLQLDRFFINQKAKLIELVNEYKIRDENGADVGIVRQEGQTLLKKAARFVSSLDPLMTHRLAVYDMTGVRVCEMVRPRTLWRSRVELLDGSGRQMGLIGQKKMFGKIGYSMEDATGRQVAEIRAENWRAWDFAIVDGQKREIGRITKKWAGVGKELFTTADNYMVEIHPSVTGDLRLMALASAAGIDLTRKQQGGLAG
jgi:uncharacterized protein YxjI